MHASPERSGALYRLAGKKAEAVKTRTKTTFPVPIYSLVGTQIIRRLEPKYGGVGWENYTLNGRMEFRV